MVEFFCGLLLDVVLYRGGGFPGVMKLTGSSDNDIKATINGWSSAFWVDSLENGGVRFNFNGSSRNMRDGYSGTAVECVEMVKKMYAEGK